jgi:hypothetical protein
LREVIEPAQFFLGFAVGVQRIPQRHFESAPLADLRLQRQCPLLKMRDHARRILGRSFGTLRGHHVRVALADRVEHAAIGFFEEVPHGVATEEREAILLQQDVPHLFQPDRPVGISVLPEDVDHLTVGADVSVLFDRSGYEATDVIHEEVEIRNRSDHERRQRRFCIEEREASGDQQFIEVDSASAESGHEGGVATLSRNDDHAFALARTSGEEVSDE